MPYIANRQDGNRQAILLEGEWTVGNAAGIEKDLSSLEPGDSRGVVDGKGLCKLDTAGAWLIRKHFPSTELRNISQQQKDLLEFVPKERKPTPTEDKPRGFVAVIIRIGEATVWSADFLYAIFSFLGNVFIRIARNLRHPTRFRIPSIIRHMQETGIQALPIIGLLAFGISMRKITSEALWKIHLAPRQQRQTPD